MHKMDREVIGGLGQGTPGPPLIWGFSSELTAEDLSLIYNILNQSGAVQFRLYIRGASDVLSHLNQYVDQPGHVDDHHDTIIHRFDAELLESDNSKTLLQEAWKANYACQMWIGGGSDSDLDQLSSIFKLSRSSQIPAAFHEPSNFETPFSNQACAIRMGYDGLCLIIDLWKGEYPSEEYANIARTFNISLSYP